MQAAVIGLGRMGRAMGRPDAARAGQLSILAGGDPALRRQGYGRRIADDQYEPAGFTLPLGLKDVGLALALGDAAVLLSSEQLRDCTQHAQSPCDNRPQPQRRRKHPCDNSPHIPSDGTLSRIRFSAIVNHARTPLSQALRQCAAFADKGCDPATENRNVILRTESKERASDFLTLTRESCHSGSRERASYR